MVIEGNRQINIEEYLSILQEPGSVFIGYVVPKTGSANNTLISIDEFLKAERIDRVNLWGLGYDGTNTNTGCNNGIIKLFENKLGLSMQWLSCQFHANELPLRHLIIHLDGPTTGPLDKALNKVEERSVSFKTDRV
jgi:hypothetical protein